MNIAKNNPADKIVGSTDGLGGNWIAPHYRPPTDLDVELDVVHQNYSHAKTDEERAIWRGVFPGKWIDHNGGGYTWEGLAGTVCGWRHLPPNAEVSGGGAFPPSA